MMTDKKPGVIIILIAFLILIIGGWFYYSKISEVNYLIPGVPYNGIYNLFFKRDVNSSMMASIMDILGYWGDERFSTADLGKQLALKGANPDVPGFFKSAGYEIYQWTSPEPGNELKEIKKFVNAQKRIPVIVSQKRSIVGENPAPKPRVVIGVFDKEKKVIVHDYFFGNNYEISYDDFERMFTKNARAILAVWPSDAIKGIIKGPDYNMTYPARLEAMDKLGPVMANYLADATFYRLNGDFERSNASYKKLIDDANFQYFPRAFQVVILASFAYTYNSLNKFDEAINIINERALPMNYNLGEATQGWFVPAGADEFSSPYYELSRAYFKKGQKDLAIASYKKYKQIETESKSIVQELDSDFVFPQIPELEKEILSQ